VFRVPKSTPRKLLASDGYLNYVENHPLVFGTVTVVDMAAYEVILGKPWFTGHNPIVDWRRHELRLLIDGRTVVVAASASPQRDSSKDITRISATQLKNVVRRQEPVYMVNLCQIGVDPDPAKGSRLPDAWEYMLDEFSDVFPVDQQGLPPELSVAMEIELEEGAKPVVKPAFRLSPAEIDELKKKLGLLLEKGLVRPSVSPWGCSSIVCAEKGRRFADEFGLSGT
jgi:hypothetical protein